MTSIIGRILRRIFGDDSINAEAKVDQLAADQGMSDLDWRNSAVDLMKVLGLDASLVDRQQLGKELGYPGDPNDAAALNTWLHGELMREITVGDR